MNVIMGLLRVLAVVTLFVESIAVWPQPATITGSLDNTILLDTAFTFKVASGSSRTLTAAVARYTSLLRELNPSWQLSDHLRQDTLASLSVAVEDPSVPLTFGVDESYKLDISAGAATLIAPNVWGCMHGLETFLQLADRVDVNQPNAPAVPSNISIFDQPRYLYRGLMMDLSRHYYSVEFIKHTMDAMVANKLNVLHLHITDDQSFPIESTTYPNLTTYGAFSERTIYHASDVQDLVGYANDLGIHLVPEFDMPAHSSSWGAGYPNLMINGTGCSPKLFTHGDTLDPTSDSTYSFLDNFLDDMMKLFPGEFLHLGGDEVPVACWGSSDRVKAFMTEHKMVSVNDVESYFVNSVANGTNVKGSGKVLMYWEEIFNNHVNLPSTAIIQAWKTNAMPGVIAANHRVTNSYKWYLNHGCNNYGDGVWGDFYTNDPLNFAPGITPEQEHLVLGGETTMWSECVDEVIFDSIVWPRTSAAAEQLWSPRNQTKSASVDVGTRLSKFRCMMVRRGIRSAPVDDSDNPRIFNQGCQ